MYHSCCVAQSSVMSYDKRRLRISEQSIVSLYVAVVQVCRVILNCVLINCGGVIILALKSFF